MLEIFTKFADLIIYDLAGMEKGSHLAGSIHFFIEDTTKIFFLLIVMIYTIAWLRASLNIEKVREYLSGHNRFIGYVAGAVFGAVTPFCSCSSIPLFFGFTQARIPLGITMSFLITSPIVNEVAVVLLGSLLGVKFMIIYVTVGIISGIIGGAFLDTIKAERFLTPLVKNISNKKMVAVNERTDQKLTLKDRHNFAKDELFSIFSRVWIWVIAGVGLGAAL
ncbi:MAG TPA: permease, partial [bacterium]|nr:permease [bacterium]